MSDRFIKMKLKQCFSQFHSFIALIILCQLNLFLVGCGSEGQNSGSLAVATATANLTNPSSLNKTETIGSKPTVPNSLIAQTNQPSQPSAITDTNDWKNRWLKGIPCKPPCWENIIPNQTTAETAAKLVAQLPFIGNVEIKDPNPIPPVSKYGYVHLVWKEIPGKTPSIGGGGSLSYLGSSPTKIITKISLSYGFIKLEDVIKAYGEPEYVIATFIHNHPTDKYRYNIYFVYLSMGFEVGSGELEQKPIMNSNIMLQGLWLHSSNNKKF